MTISLNWLKDYIDLPLPAQEISDLLTNLGLEVEGMEETESIKGGLEGVLVGHVVETWKHPNAGKLTLTKVDVGSGEPLQIVCGAPNVAAGQKVLVATAGTTLYPIEGEPVKLKKGNIRGEVSEGMICAEDELGVGTNHSGIMVLPEDTPVGTSGRDYFNIEKEVIYEIGLTPNRSDATCHLGVARDLAAALKVQLHLPGEVKIPSVDNFKVDNASLPVKVIVENTEACPHYAGVSIKGVTIGESPEWLKKRLLSIGVRPISNIVDITNFILHELGQPLHAFDLDEITGRTIRVKTLPQGTKFTTLDEQERSLSGHDLMICDGNSNGLCIGGVFGGIKSGVKETTKNIFLESAHFNAGWIRRTSTRHDLRTSAAKVFEKGSDPNICVYALKRAAAMMVELAGGQIASEVVDVYPNPIAPAKVEVAYEYVNRLIGTNIPHSQIREILLALGMEIVAGNDATFTVAVPTNKADVTRPADVVEEILRVYGLGNVPVPTQIRSSMVRNEYPLPGDVRNATGDYLAANGFCEMMALSLSQSAYYKDALPGENAGLVFVNNTSNVQLDIMRHTMLFSGLEAIVQNQNRQQAGLKLFEFGKTYHKQTDGGADKYIEDQHLSLFITGQRWPESWRNTANTAADFFTLKAFVDNVLHRLGISGFQETIIYDDVFAFGKMYHRGPQTLATFGKVQPKICKMTGIKGEAFYADMNWDLLLDAQKHSSISLVELNRFPTVRRDLALVVGKSVKFADLAALAKKVGKKFLKEINLFDVFEDESKLGTGKKSYALSFTFEDTARTLQDIEIEEVMSQLIGAYETKLEAVVRR
ncbi:MAG: phenylalanine--tRNA ligase subunit beta [Saprospiraceae bacterium]|nr:MAG: phenylalanine--tRNA ligase subunit beta [Saprospiraceae bacterium]